VMYIPRYLMVSGFAVLGLVYLQPEMAAMGANIDFEKVLPLAINKFVPIGFKGLLIAGLLAAFMGTFSAIINAAPAYIVNDIYKKYIRPDAPAEVLIRYSLYASLILVIVGIGFGFNAESLNRLTLWITSALYGGYAAANMLKWVWWRFNGYGYFGGMVAGLIISTIILFFKPQVLDLFALTPNLPDIFLFPLVLGVSLIGCVIGTYIAPLENEEQVIRFYRDTQPWGWWGPIRKKLLEQEPDWKSTTSFKRDAFNVVIGMIWQMAQVVIPMYFMIKNNTQLAIWTIIFFISSYLLKKFWWDRLND
jgi:SSS family solute:Na+ symporter